MFEVIAEKNEYVQKFVIVVLVLLFFFDKQITTWII